MPPNPSDNTQSEKARIVDPFGRSITYLRLSVTDRCDFRCRYCMAEEMTFLPRSQVLSLEECALVARAFVELGVTKIRLTGGEPLVRHNFIELARNLGQMAGLKELALTTNGSQLDKYAVDLVRSGVKRVNISLDSLNAESFRNLTRTGELSRVIRGIEAARNAGFERIKINAVILREFNERQVLPLLDFCLERGLDISFIEEMPLGDIQDDHSRSLSFVSSAELRESIAKKYSLVPSTQNTGGPSRYWTTPGYDNRIGFISPHSENFCASCNRVRVTATGQLILCLGHENAVDLLAVTRRNPGDVEPIKEAILQGITNKPEKHDFTHDDTPQVVRFMNMTGG
ncbi:MAG: GTP 3',8-cyclase MoaA [bacterium]